jgi:two-component system, NarL family, sensor histidine kinase DegS
MTDPQRLLTRMLVSTINARELESGRVARTLHDEVGQVLSAVGLQLDVLKLDFQDKLPELVDRTREIQRLLDKAMSEVRALSYDLNPAVVERIGLRDALDRLVGRFRQNYAGSIRFLFDSSVRVPLAVGNAWYKITEMALDNAIRHSGATKIEVHLRPTVKALTLEIKDNGTGFSPMDAKWNSTGLGLLLMEHYASQADVDVNITSIPGKGTAVKTSHLRSKESRTEPRG